MERREESVEARGRNVEEAIANGLARLGVRRDQVEIEVLSRGSRGVLGLGAEDARVLLKRVVVEPVAPVEPTPKPVEEPERPVPRPRVEPSEQAAPVEAREVGLSVEEVEAEEEEEGPGAVVSEDVETVATEALKGLLKHMGVSATVIVKEPTGSMLEGDNPPPLVLDVEGNDLGILIGRRGETLSALQYLVRLMVNRQTHRWVNIIVDVEGYKARREQQLQQLAERMAERVVASQKPVVLEAMPPYERRIVHLALREHPQVTTHSIGEDESRKVMIVLRQ